MLNLFTKDFFYLLENLSKKKKRERGWIKNFYFKYSIKMLSNDLILEVNYINIWYSRD